MSQLITEQLDIKETSWCMLVLFLLINLVRVEVEAYYGDVEYEVVTLWLFLVVPYFLLGLGFVAVAGIEQARAALMRKVGVETVDDLEQALLRSRATTTGGGGGGGASTASLHSPSTAAHRNPRASIVLVNQQQALDAYLPLLLDGLFPYNRPTLFPKLLEFVMLTQCFFIGLACIFHIRQAVLTFSPTIASLYILFTMLPHLLVLLVIAPHVLTTYVLVHSLAYVNRDVLHHVTSFMQETTQLRDDIRHYLHDYLTQANLTLPDLFLRLTKGSSTLPTPHLRSSLADLGVQLTMSQASRLTRLVNMQQDGQVTLREFALFVLGSEGSAGLTLVPIVEGMKGELVRVSERGREERMEAEVRKGKGKADGEGGGTVAVDVGEEGVLVLQERREGGDAQPTAHSPAHLPHSATPTSPASLHSPHTPLSLPHLDLRNAHSAKAHQHHNLFISHTLDHPSHPPPTHPSHPHHHHPHHLHHSHHKKAAAGRADVDALDFAACFHGAETACRRCGKAVLVRRVEDHVKECTGEGGGGDGVGVGVGDRGRVGSMPDRGEGMGGPVSSSSATVVAVDDIVLNDSRGGSKRGTRTSGRGALPVVRVRADGKVELFMVEEGGEAGKGTRKPAGVRDGEAAGVEGEEERKEGSRRDRLAESTCRRSSHGSL